jgi:hypothetical protein
MNNLSGNLHFGCLSSSLMFGITLFRNQPGIANKILAQPGYALTAIVATIETITALIFFGLSGLVYPLTSHPFTSSRAWVESSGFTVVWASIDAALNLFMRTLIADELSAHFVAASGNLMRVPRGAYV